MLCLDSFLLLSRVISLWPWEEGYNWRGFLRLWQWLSWADACFTGMRTQSPSTQVGDAGVVPCAYNPVQGVEAVRSWAVLLRNSRPVRPCLRTRGNSCSWGMTYQAVLWLSHVMLSAHMCMHIPTEFPFCTSASALMPHQGHLETDVYLNCKLTVFSPQCSSSFMIF